MFMFSALAQEVSRYRIGVAASPELQGGIFVMAIPRAPGVTKQVSMGRSTVGLMILACWHSSSRKKARVPGAAAREPLIL